MLLLIAVSVFLRIQTTICVVLVRKIRPIFHDGPGSSCCLTTQSTALCPPSEIVCHRPYGVIFIS